MSGIFGYDDVANHAMMLVDGVRMRAFADAITRTIRSDDVVVDIGAGSGILSLLCAKAGARRVYAIERGPMAELVEEAARENGFADVVQVMRVDARTASFSADALPTIIVSEMIGSFGIDEDFIGLLGDVAIKCAPECRFLPTSVDVQLALAALPHLHRELALIGDGLGIKLGGLRERLVHRPALTHADSSTILTSATRQRFLPGGARPGGVGGRVAVDRADEANAIVSWFTSELCPGVELTSAPGSPATHWAHVVFPLDPPLAVQPGDELELEVRPRLLTDRGSYAWSVRRGNELRSGDAMKSLVGTKDDMLAQLGLRAKERTT